MSNNLATKDIKNLFHPATNLKIHEHGKPLILDRGDGTVSYTHLTLPTTPYV